MRLALIILLSSLTAIAPLSIDAYLPAMPIMADELHVSIHDIELSLSLFLGGYAIGQLIGGPLSDHFGRRFGIFTGLILFSLGTLPILFVESLHWLWLLRVIEALGVGIAVVNTSAIIRDHSSGKDSARNLAHVAAVMMLAPLLAPLIGTGILHLASWRSIFGFLLIYGVLLVILIHYLITETRQPSTQPRSSWQRYREVISHRPAMAFCASVALAYAGLFTFVTTSPSVYMGYFGASESLYPFLFGANVISMIGVNRLNVRLLHHFTPHQLLIAGQVLQCVFASGLLAYVTLSNAPQLGIVVFGMVAFFGTIALVVSNGMASAIEYFPHNSATATAMIGASSFGLSALVGSLVAHLGDGTPMPMVALLFCTALLAPVLRWLIAPAHGAPHVETT